MWLKFKNLRQSALKYKIYFSAMLLMVLLAPSVVFADSYPTDSTTDTAHITINANRILGPVNRKVLGSNVIGGEKWTIKGKNWRKLAPRWLGAIRTGSGVWNPKTMKPNPLAVKLVKALHVGPLRYPGGTLVHGYNWKDAVGSLKMRGQWRFGIDQYIAFCRAVGAEPQFVMNEYSSSPKEAAQLVEYLNSPATPNHPWAMKRALWGHPKPYHVKYFEFGNETNTGNQKMTPPKQYTGAQYAALFKKTAAAMRAVDPNIKIGLVAAAGAQADSPWTIAAIKGAGKDADFVIAHVYAVRYHSNKPHPDIARMMQACMAADQQQARRLAEYHRIIKKYVGRDLPVAITEYNASFIQMKPKPFRYSYGPALFSADYVRVMLMPSSNVLLANYFELINGYWGMIHKPGGDLRSIWKGNPKKLWPMAAYPLYKLWGNHLGKKVTAVKVSCPHIDFKGFLRTRPARGNRYQPSKQLNQQSLITINDLYRLKRKHYTIGHQHGGLLVIKFNGLTGHHFPALQKIKLPAKFCPPKGGLVRVSFEARYIPKAGSGKARLGMGLMDARGWKATGNAIAVATIESAHNWKKFSGTLKLLPDAKGVILLARLLAGDKAVYGTIDIRNLHVNVLSRESYPAYPAVTAFSSIGNHGKTLYLMVFNKSTKKAMHTTIDLKGFLATSARYWQVTGPSLAANNIKKQRIKITTENKHLPLSSSHQLRCTFPPISMTAIEFYR